MWILCNSALNKGHDGESTDYHEKECSKDDPVELVEEQEVGFAALYQPTLWEPYEDHTKEKTEEEGPDEARKYEDLTYLDDHAAIKSFLCIQKCVRHQNSCSIHWGQQAWTESK